MSRKLGTYHKLTLNDIAERVARFSDGEYYFLIWRPSYQAQYQQISQAEYQWLVQWQTKVSNAETYTERNAKSQQLSIGNALDKMTEVEFSFIDWLPKAIEQQLINSMSKLAPS